MQPQPAKQFAESLSGLIERVTYFNEENGWAVLKVKAKGSYLNSLVLPCKENGFRPPVRSIVLRKRGAKTGVRLVELACLRAYLNEHAEPAYKKQGEATSAA